MQRTDLDESQAGPGTGQSILYEHLWRADADLLHRRQGHYLKGHRGQGVQGLLCRDCGELPGLQPSPSGGGAAGSGGKAHPYL